MITDTPSFSSFGLSTPVLDALVRKGFSAPSSIQAIALPRLLADEGHLIVKARTGTGKTAAFGIPLVEWIKSRGHAPRALILSPTRELALQISREIASFIPAEGDPEISRAWPRITAVYGGASIRNQIFDLKRGTEIVVGTPGRVMDLMERKVLDLSALDWFILDEADEMLDMGFFEDVETIMKVVKPERRVALFSATMPEAILQVVRQHIGDVEILEDALPEDEKPAVDQFYMILKKEDKLEALRRIIDSSSREYGAGAENGGPGPGFYGLVFCATKAGTDELARRLAEADCAAEAIHGDLSQEERERTLRRFRSRQTTILVATDVAARGLDIERLTHVVNWDLPNDRETYVHRIGRTGRAGRRGTAISLALPSERERIQRLSRSMERVMGSGIRWMKVPTIKSLMKVLRGKIVSSVMEVLPPPDPETDMAGIVPQNSDSGLVESPLDAPFLSKVCGQLLERLGPERAITALLTLHYGELLDPSRYGPVTEFPEFPAREEGRPGSKFRHSGHERRAAALPRQHGIVSQGYTRVYVGLGRKHGASPRDVVAFLIRAGDIPGRLVDAIEMKDYCAFASMPADAARRACEFSRKTPKDPVIKPAIPPKK